MFEQISANKRRSAYLVVAFVAVVAAVGWAFNTLIGGGPLGLLVAGVFVAATSFGAYWKSDALALRMSRAKLADPVEHARLHNLVEGLCIAAGVPKPRVYVIDDPAPNAFATGRDPRHAAIACTTGLLEKLNRVELEGVLAHELSHIKNYDILVSTLAVTMVGIVVLLANWGMRFMWFGGRRRDRDNPAGAVLAVVSLALLVLSPLIARLMQSAVSRRRETLADITGVSFTRYPPGLISALEKLRDDTTVVGTGSHATAHLWIESPVPRAESEGRFARLGRMFDTHPPLEERIQALREL